MKSIWIKSKALRRVLLFALVTVELNVLALIIYFLLDAVIDLAGRNIDLRVFIFHPIWLCFVLMIGLFSTLIAEVLDDHFIT